MKRTDAKVLVLTLMTILCLASPLKSQERFSISAGVGSPELVHLDLRVPLADQLQLGASIGSGFGMVYIESDDESKEKARAFALELSAFYHFAGQSAHTHLKPWYLRAGLNYLRFDEPEAISKYTTADMRLGRAFNLSPRFGLELDAGLTYLIIHNHETKPGAPPQGLPVIVEPNVLPAFGLRLFYRI